jgi:hypothetical protein
MKRPAFTPKDIGVTAPDEGGGLILHLKDAQGNTQTVKLSASLRETLLQMLMSGPLLEEDRGTPALYLSPTRTRTYVRQNGEFALELQIGPGRAVHVMLQGLQADALAIQIQELQASSIGPIQ